MKPQVAWRFCEVAKHLLEPCRNVTGAIRRRGDDNIEAVRIAITEIGLAVDPRKETKKSELLQAWRDDSPQLRASVSRGRRGRGRIEPHQDARSRGPDRIAVRC